MLQTMHQLYPRGAANRGICVDAEGAMLGPMVLVSRTGRSFRAIDRDKAFMLQKCLPHFDRDRDWLFHQCQRIATALDRGEIALAQIFGLRIPVGELDDPELKRIAAARVAKAGFNPAEPRVPAGSGRESGEWTSDGGSSAGSAAPDAETGTISPAHGSSDGDTSPDGAAVTGPADHPVSDQRAHPKARDTTSPGGAAGGDRAPEPTSNDKPPIVWEMRPLDTAASSNVAPANPSAAPNSVTAAPQSVGSVGLSAPTAAALFGDASPWTLGDLAPATEAALKLLL
ncbi:MAG: hypothetical protein JO258_18725, partial [Alphaproteobacteria bacterium]|nr:hypothetical protein [Alphaproteobacteria bacterium]